MSTIPKLLLRGEKGDNGAPPYPPRTAGRGKDGNAHSLAHAWLDVGEERKRRVALMKEILEEICKNPQASAGFYRRLREQGAFRERLIYHLVRKVV